MISCWWVRSFEICVPCATLLGGQYGCLILRGALARVGVWKFHNICAIFWLFFWPFPVCTQISLFSLRVGRRSGLFVVWLCMCLPSYIVSFWDTPCFFTFCLCTSVKLCSSWACLMFRSSVWSQCTTDSSRVLFGCFIRFRKGFPASVFPMFVFLLTIIVRVVSVAFLIPASWPGISGAVVSCDWYSSLPLFLGYSRNKFRVFKLLADEYCWGWQLFISLSNVSLAERHLPSYGLLVVCVRDCDVDLKVFEPSERPKIWAVGS